jgi:hypothetical protein
MANSKNGERYSEEETTRRMNEALKRALHMPPKPHKPLKSGKPTKKRSQGHEG